MSLFIDGKVYEVPGIYGAIDVANTGNVNIPAFNGVLFVGKSRQGIPFNATGKKGSEIIKAFNSVKYAKDFYGISDLSKAFEEAKRGGAGTCYFITPAQLTQASAVINDTQTTPVPILTLKPTIYGAPGNDVHIGITNASGKISIELVPSKLTKFLLEDLDSTGKSSIKIDNVEGLRVGQTVKFEDNGTSTNYATATITDIDSDNNIVTVDATIVSLTQSDYARMFVPDTNKTKSATFLTDESGLLNKVMDWFNSTGIVIAERSDTQTGDITLIEAVDEYLGSITNAVKGTSPEATETASGDFDSLAEALPQLIEEFTNYTKARIRLIVVLSSKANVHSKYLTFAETMRAQQSSVQIISGVAKGDIDKATSDSDNPITRAKALNSDDFILAGMGYENKDAYLSLAPYIAGLLSSNRPSHNITEDSIIVNSVEKFFGESNKDTETVYYVRAGIMIIGTGKNGYYLVHGFNTYQDHTDLWNESDEKTYLVQQRQSADYFFEVYYTNMQVNVGTEITLNTLRAKGIDIINEAISKGIIVEGGISEAYREGNALVTIPEVKLPEATDFIGFIVRILN